MIHYRQMILPGYGTGEGLQPFPCSLYIHGKHLHNRIRWYFKVHESLAIPREPTAKVIRDALRLPSVTRFPLGFSRTRLVDLAHVYIVAADIDTLTNQGNEYWLNPANPDHLADLGRMIRGRVNERY